MGELAGLLPFDPRIREWFLEAVGTPTAVQSESWPRIAAGEHLLITAPTGSGKTFTAFLWALDRLLTGAWAPGRLRVLYVSPLRALGTDIRRNLELPLAGLEQRLRDAGREPPTIRAETRSGDTPQKARRRMLRQPPEILITTPESLNVLLTSVSGRELLGDLETVILDEIHAVAGSKRGTHLITALERLVPLSGEFQRIALSATVEPLDLIARFVGGYRSEPMAGARSYRARTVGTVRVSGEKRYDVTVRFPAETFPENARPAGDPAEDGFWPQLASDLEDRIRRNRSTLIFANSRRLTEKVTRLINDDAGAELAYAHHGSLAREVRAEVERRLKAGELEAIVATSSLELGIDVGALDEVLLIGTPRTAAAAIQRVGRAGHGVGEISRGVIYPIYGRDLLDAAVVSRALLEQAVEEIRPLIAPLDVLAQVVLSMVATETWEIDRVLDVLRTSWPYRELSRRQLDRVLEMLAGRYADSHIRALRPRVDLDRVADVVRGRPGAARLVYLSGGTIPDRGYFALRVEGSMAKIGELDEEFVWERSVGDTLTLGTQSWQIRKITHNDVLVAPHGGAASMAPFWRADAQDRSFVLSRRIGRFLAWADEHMGDEKKFLRRLTAEYPIEESAARELFTFLGSQREATGCLPHSRRLLLERTRAREGDEGRERVILHTFWGGEINRPLALALAAAWEEREETPLEVVSDDDCVLLVLPRRVDVAELLGGLVTRGVVGLVRRTLEATGFFGAQFRLAAATALLLPRASFRQRTPLWLNRQRAKRLLTTVRDYEDFPILVETWRSCLEDAFDLGHLEQLLAEVVDGEIEIREVRTSAPSPFAANLIWMQTNQMMYQDDAPEAGGSKLRPELIEEVIFQADQRPRLEPELVARFARKLRRVAPGYAPGDAADLLVSIDERLLVPVEEWRELLAAIDRDHGAERATALTAELEERLLAVTPPAVAGSPPGDRAVATLDSVARLVRILGRPLEDFEPRAVEPPGGGTGEAPSSARAGVEILLERDAEQDGGDQSGGETRRVDDLARLVGEWLRFYGPFPVDRLGSVFALADGEQGAVLERLEAERKVVIGELTLGAARPEVCEVENLERLLRLKRRAARPAFTALPADYLPLFLAHHQGLTHPGDGIEDLKERLEALIGFAAPAAAWETDILPARLDPYFPAWLDSLLQTSELFWLGIGPQRVAFVFPGDLELLADPAGAGGAANAEEEEDEAELERRLAELFPDPRARRELAELAAERDLGPAELSRLLWRLAWHGRVSNDTFLTLRRALASRFQPPPAKPAGDRRAGRAARAGRRGPRWQSQQPDFGRWFRVPRPSPPGDALERELLDKDRARLLLERYGVLFRELLGREHKNLRWSRVFRALRLMELSGEVLAGYFFEGVGGLQFISHAAYRTLREGLPEDAIYWLSAADPASACGIDVAELKSVLPARRRSTRLVFHGRRPVLVARRGGRELDLEVPPDHPELATYLKALKTLLYREVLPRQAIAVETINGEPAPKSPYARRLAEHFRATREPRALKLWKRYRGQ